ncbi:uncharacterized protein CCR75_004660 [Bremia lactucae]|uniref:Uncharacterized protein n=1 Tax=Bremia lactucae TaxID=4779 RepID=A0A976FRM8_BRELC|nr:hypothetical protein CCR75_004660 [Bremia lactucae]
MTTAHDTHAVTLAELILQFIIHALQYVTTRMTNARDHDLLHRVTESQLRVEQKNAELLADAQYCDDKGPEEEMSDFRSSDEEEMEAKAIDLVVEKSTAQNQLFDGLHFYLTVSRVREGIVTSVLAAGMAKTLKQLQKRKENESIALIQQQYPDFTCPLTKNAAVQPICRAEEPPLRLLAALRLPLAETVSSNQALRKKSTEDGRMRRPSLSLHGPTISRGA